MVQKNVLIVVFVALVIIVFVANLAYNYGSQKGYDERRAFEIEVLQPMQQKQFNRAMSRAKRPIIIVFPRPKTGPTKEDRHGIYSTWNYFYKRR